MTHGTALTHEKHKLQYYLHATALAWKTEKCTTMRQLLIKDFDAIKHSIPKGACDHMCHCLQKPQYECEISYVQLAPIVINMTLLVFQMHGYCIPHAAEKYTSSLMPRQEQMLINTLAQSSSGHGLDEIVKKCTAKLSIE